MAAQRFKDFLFSYSGLISSAEEIQMISDYFSSIQTLLAQADCSEIIDLSKYTIQRNPIKIRRLLRSQKDEPFIFVACMN